MSVSGFEQEYVAAPGARQIYARPLGSVAASMMGVTALLTLGLALALTVKSAKLTPENGATQAEASPVPTPAAPKRASSLDLTVPEFSQEKKALSSREFDGGREDSLTLGQFAAQGPYLRVDLRLGGAEKRANADFFLDLTRHASGAGLAAIRIGQPSPLATRFGVFEAADIRLSLAAPDGAASERACVALRLQQGKAPLEIAGLFCGAGAKSFDRKSVGCMIDRLEYAPDGADAALKEFFQAVDAERAKSCGGAPGAAADKTAWIEAHSRAPETRADPLPPKYAKKAR